LAFTMDVRGDASGAWPRLQVADADGTVTNLDGDMIDHEGWEQVRFTVPEGLAQPLTVQRVRMMETRPEAQYSGDIAVANLEAITTPTAETPEEPAVHDAALLATGSVVERPQQIAVMSDAQFVAADPDSGAVEGARRTLREIKDADPDLLVINGDFVDEASPEDFALAAQILEEEWGGDIPYVYVPGNHEVMGGDISTFEAAFGPVTTQQDLGGTRVVTLNTSSGTLAGGGIDQIAELEASLEEAAGDEDLTGVTVFFHHPPTDPLASKSSQLTDQREARAVEDLLADFRRTSGKSVALVNGHVGAFHGAAVDGVTTLINGNSGKSPAGTPATGGFTGWTMLGIDPAAGDVGTEPSTQDRVDWLAAETHPWVDEISVQAPRKLTVGGVGDASASFSQDGRTMPVAWPVTSQWGGEGVQVLGDGAESSDRRGVVRLNPTTGEITGMRPGTATLSVTVNGRTATTTVEVAGH
ncbi:MAG: metallophosphoesterase family protein, partial [Dermabacteraceae bacterium]